MLLKRGSDDVVGGGLVSDFSLLSKMNGGGGCQQLNHRGKRGLILLVSVFSIIILVYYLHVIGGFSDEKSLHPKYLWRPEYAVLNGPLFKAGDKGVLEKLRNNHLIGPSLKGYNLENDSSEYDPSMGQSQVIRKLFGEMKGGFFIECGALDGETRSNTLYLERTLGWEGLLIEADPENFKVLKEKGRRAWSSDSCISLQKYPTMVSFEQKVNQGKISRTYKAGFVSTGFVDAQCFPFETYMVYLNRTVLDYFSLDVEGNELEVLKTIDFEKFYIKSLSVEFIHDVEGKEAIQTFMDEKGYKVLTEVTNPNWLANDFIFVKKSWKS